MPGRRRARLTMDALSDLLRQLRFEAGVFLDARFRGPWCVRSQVTAAELPALGEAPGALVAFHYVLEGTIDVRVGEQPPHRAGPGDLILVPRNDVHLLGNDLRLPPVQAEPFIRRSPDGDLASLDHGSGEGDHRMVCGYLATPVHGHPLLASLPGLIVTTMRGQPGAEWVDSSFRYVAGEQGSRRAGSGAVVAQLASLLFVEALRRLIEGMPAEAAGWLAALRDPCLARALSALHQRVAHPWTTEELAREAFLSRSAFAERFTAVLGMPPMSYLTRWRMLVASRRLRESPASIARIAGEVGYESESTFTRAFTREIGCPPGVFRRRGVAGPAESAIPRSGRARG